MLSIRTNLSSFIAKNSLQTSTNNLNQAIERMTTGAKLNHAKDNAANYSINTNMTTKIGAYDVAADNTAMGMDMVTTASENLSLLENKLSRLRVLATQSNNGTYGGQSLLAINAEANALVDEINRIYKTAEYNGVKIFDNVVLPPIPAGVGDVSAKEEYGGFIADPVTYSETQINNMAKLSSVSDSATISSGEYAIWTDEDLGKLKKMADDGLIKGGTFVLADDIDMASYCATNGWSGIGGDDYFKGTFDGNGNVISNLKGTNGLFSMASSIIKNVGLKNVNIISENNTIGALVGYADNNVINCFVDSGKIKGSDYVGGLIGEIYGNTTDCYSNASVEGGDSVGGLIGYTEKSVTNCFAKGNVKASKNVGGVVGGTWGSYQILNVFSECSITGEQNVGGLIGNCFLVFDISNSYSMGNVKGESFVGGILGSLPHGFSNQNDVSINNCYTYSHVEGAESVGSVIGGAHLSGSDSINLIINNVNVIPNDLPSFGGAYSDMNLTNRVDNYDLSSYEAQITQVALDRIEEITLQIGINSDVTSRLTINTEFEISEVDSLRSIGLTNGDLTQIDSLLSKVAEKQTLLGSVSNRLESVLDEILIQHDNLVSSRSTIRDADIAEVSSQYIQQQILQQASATLLSSAQNIQAQNVLGLLQSLR